MQRLPVTAVNSSRNALWQEAAIDGLGIFRSPSGFSIAGSASMTRTGGGAETWRRRSAWAIRRGCWSWCVDGEQERRSIEGGEVKKGQWISTISRPTFLTKRRGVKRGAFPDGAKAKPDRVVRWPADNQANMTPPLSHEDQCGTRRQPMTARTDERQPSPHGKPLSQNKKSKQKVADDELCHEEGFAPNIHTPLNLQKQRHYQAISHQAEQDKQAAMPASELNAGSWVHNISGYLLYVVLIATAGPLQFGFHLAELNAPAEVITCEKKSVSSASLRLPQCIPMSEAIFVVVSSIFTLGGLIGALNSGPASSKYGRRRAMQGMAAFFAVGSFLEAIATNVPMIAIGRLLSGIGAGSAVVVGPIYVAEVSPLDQRGLFGAFSQVMTNTGILVAVILGYFLSRGQLWRIILLTGSVIGFIQVLGLFFVVESPKWTAAHRSPLAGRRDLRRIRGARADIDGEFASWGEDGIIRIEPEEQGLLGNEDPDSRRPSAASVPETKANIVGIVEVIRDPEYRPAIIAVVTVMAAQQLCGINSIFMYSVALLSDLFPTSSSLLLVAVSVINVVATVLGAPLADRIGRVACLLLSIAGMGINSLLLAVSIKFNVPILSAIATLLFVTSFSIGLGPIPFILASELVEHDAVGATQSWALASSWVATFLVAQFFPLLNNLMGKGNVYFLFAALALAFFAFIAWWVPESKGKSNPDEVWGRRRLD